jgi:hypothetical protein
METKHKQVPMQVNVMVDEEKNTIKMKEQEPGTIKPHVLTISFDPETLAAIKVVVEHNTGAILDNFRTMDYDCFSEFMKEFKGNVPVDNTTAAIGDLMVQRGVLLSVLLALKDIIEVPWESGAAPEPVGSVN